MASLREGPNGGKNDLMKKFALWTVAATLIFGVAGCFSLSWAHNRRHVRKIIDEIVLLHQDVDKVIFGLDRNPAE